ncbi:hypothetical protein ACHAP5_010630 [Fusarium lateritium]
MAITHPKVKGASDAKVTLPYVRFSNKESLAEYVECVSEKGLVEIGIKMAASHKTIKAQSFAINALKYPQTANPRPPVSQSQGAYRYSLRFDPRVAQQVSLIKEFPGIENVIDKKAAPVFIQSIFDTLPLPMQTCLADLRESIAGLHSIAGVAGSGKLYLMEVLMLFPSFGDGPDKPHNLKILYIINNNTTITNFPQIGNCKGTFRSRFQCYAPLAFNVMRLYPLEGEVSSAVAEAKPQQDDIEDTNIAEEFVTSEVIRSLYTEVSKTKSATTISKNANRNKSLHRLANRTLTQDPERHSGFKEEMDRIKNGENLPQGDFATFKELVKELYHQIFEDPLVS